MSRYKVLWFDDEWEELEEISEEALDFDIELIGVSNAEKGLEMLNNLENFDAVLLDGRFYKDANQIKNDESDKAFGMVAKELDKRVGSNNFIPWFILSGQPSFVKEDNKLVELFEDNSKAWGGDKVHDKNDDDNTSLWKDMVKAIETTDSYIIKKKYSAVFQVITNGTIAKEHNSRLISVIQNIHNPDQINNAIDLFNPLRKIIEGVKDKMIDLNIIPSDLPFNKLSYFVAGEHNQYSFKKEIAPPVIKHLFKNVIPILQEASHGKKEMLLSLEEFHHSTNRSYLYSSTAYQVMEILIWFNEYVAENSDKEENRKIWSIPEVTEESDEESEINESWIEGEIIKVENNYGTFQPYNELKTLTIIPQVMSKFGIRQGSKLNVTTKPSPDGTKIFIDKIEII